MRRIYVTGDSTLRQGFLFFFSLFYFLIHKNTFLIPTEVGYQFSTSVFFNCLYFRSIEVYFLAFVFVVHILKYLFCKHVYQGRRFIVVNIFAGDYFFVAYWNIRSAQVPLARKCEYVNFCSAGPTV